MLDFLNPENMKGTTCFMRKQWTIIDLPAGFQKAYDMVWYFSNYVLLAKNYLAMYQLKFYLQGLVSSIQMVKFLELNA